MNSIDQLAQQLKTPRWLPHRVTRLQKTIDAPKPANVEGAAEPSASEEPTVLPMVVLREQQERSSNVFTEIPVSEFFIYRRQQGAWK